jgi:hypothetical protein
MHGAITVSRWRRWRYPFFEILFRNSPITIFGFEVMTKSIRNITSFWVMLVIIVPRLEVLQRFWMVGTKWIIILVPTIPISLRIKFGVSFCHTAS